MPRTVRTPLLCAALAWLCACDNVGRAFDPDVTPNPPGPTAPSVIQVPPAGGDVRDGRPTVRATYPRAGGWPTTVPVVVEFSESMNQASIVPSTTAGSDGKVILRLESTTQALPCGYDFLAGGRLLVLRPLTPLNPPSGAAFEVVLLPGVRDADGVQVQGSSEQILSTFTIDTEASEDGEILAMYPRDNQRDLPVDTEFLAVFTRAPNAASLINTNNFRLRTAAGTIVAGIPDAPLLPADTRIVRFRPADPAGFASTTDFEFVVTSGITFGTEGELVFSGRTPFSRFSTSSVPQPISVAVGNPTAGFPDKLNRSNLGALQLAVALPAQTLANDRVLVRLYGDDRDTQTVGDLGFVERLVTVPAAGAQTITADFTGRLGSLTDTRFADGGVSMIAQIQRGNVHSGIVRGSTSAAQDTVAPTLVSLGGPVGSNGTDLFAELEHLVVFGTASETVGAVQLTVGGPPVGLFASRNNGAFVTRPVALGRSSLASAYALALFDAAGNENAAPATGSVFQRGLITGSSASGDLDVEVFDDATLRPLASVTVHVDPDAPTVPAAPGRQSATTGATGRASFSSLPGTTHTVTAIVDGYDPVTLYRTTAGFVSLPLRPSTAAQARATLAGTVTPDGSFAGLTTIAGSNLFDDVTVATVKSNGATPTVIPPNGIVPNRLQVLTAFGGAFEPTANPTYSFQGCNLLGGDLLTPTPPSVPAAAGSTVTASLLLRNGGAVLTMTPSAPVDFNQSLSLNTTGIVPVVRFLTALDGFRGQVGTGVGFGTGSIAFNVTGTYAKAMLDGLADFAPRSWLMVEVTDSIGSMCRVRVRLNPVAGTGFDQVHPQWIPLINPPGGPSTGPPMVAVFESLDTADVLATHGVQALAVLDVVARDTNGREWRLIAEDTDSRAGPPDDFQFPDPGAATGLANGAWIVRTAARLFARDTRAPGDFLLADRIRQEISFARGARTTFTVQ